MWKRGGRSSALDRAQALLSAKNRGGDAEASAGARTGPAVGSPKTSSGPPDTHLVFSDLSDLSSVSSAPKNGADTARSVTPERSQRAEERSTEDLRPPSSLAGGGSRFLKKAPLAATNSNQSPISKSRIQQSPEPGYVSSSRFASQTAALNRLAQIESRARSRMQAREQARLEISPEPQAACQVVEASVPVSAQASRDLSINGKRFLKKKADVAVDSANTAASGCPKGPGVGVRFKSGSAGAVIPSAGSEMKSWRLMSGVSLESDEEDMRKLLGNSFDSTDVSLLRPGRPISARADDKTWSKGSQKAHSTPAPPTAVVCPSSPSNAASPRSPASPSRRSSPFRFTGQAQAHFSPSVLSPSPSPPIVSPSLPRRLNSPHRVGSPNHSLSSMSGHSEVLSLEDLFPLGPHTEDPHSEMSLASSEDFKINVMSLDDLASATFGFTEETPRKEGETEHSASGPGSSNGHQKLPRLTEGMKEEDPEQEEDMLDYQSDFESGSGTEPNFSVSQISEHLQGNGDEGELASEVREEASNLDDSCGRTEVDCSSTFSETTLCSSDQSQTLQPSSKGRDSRASVSHNSQISSHQSRRRASARKGLKDAAVQVQQDNKATAWSTGMATSKPSLGTAYTNPTPVALHTLSAETVQALGTYNPSAFVLNEMLKQQLNMTRRFIESNRRLHSSLVQSLEPPNYRYTTLEDTKEYIRKRRLRTPKLTMEEALDQVLQEMRGYQCT